MKSTILCRAGFGPASLPEHAGNPYHTPSASTGSCRNTQSMGEREGSWITPSNCSPSTEQLRRVTSLKSHLCSGCPSTAVPDPRKTQLKQEVCSRGEKGVQVKGNLHVTFLRDPPFEADPKLSCCSGSPDPLLDPVSPRHFPPSSYSTAEMETS